MTRSHDARGAVGFPVPDDALAQRLATRLASVEERLHEAARHADSLADATSRHLMSAGGKRLRPLLTLLCAELGEADATEVLDAAVVVELTHLASLYHDDVMDSAPLRRGAPAAHELWGNNVAILTGDLLFARASLTVAGLGPQAVELQARTFERLCLGQLRESVGPGEGDDPVAHYIQVLADKTASLLATSARFGAWFAGADEAYADMVAEYGERVGVAFQLADDVIDLTSPAEVTGKTPGTDLREGVATLPVLMLRASAGPEDTRLLDLTSRPLTDEAEVAEALARLRAHPVLEQARAEVVRRAEVARSYLSRLPEGPARDALSALCDQVVSRSS